jgi:virginiamycin A acetyltransferase
VYRCMGRGSRKNAPGTGENTGGQSANDRVRRILLMFIRNFLKKLYALEHRQFRSVILRSIADLEGGQPYSKTIREIFLQYHQIDIGLYSYGGCFSQDNVPGGTTIGRYCSFARMFTVLNGNHPAKFKSLHPFFYSPMFGYVTELLITRSKLVIENDVWVGHGAIILPAVTRIENGAIIGAGCVVTTNVPSYAIVAGNPGKIIKYRFNENTIEKIQASKWWEKDIMDIKEDQRELQSFTQEIE